MLLMRMPFVQNVNLLQFEFSHLLESSYFLKDIIFDQLFIQQMQ